MNLFQLAHHHADRVIDEDDLLLERGTGRAIESSNYWMSTTHPLFLPKAMGDLMRPTASLAVLIYNFSGSPFDNQIALAWTAALVLVVIVLVFNVIGQSLAGRSSD